MKFLALALILAVVGCASDEPLSTDPDQATTQIQSWVPLGTTLADARQIMQDRQFACWVMPSAKPGDPNAQPSLYCDKVIVDSDAISSVTHRWQVTIKFDKGKVSEVHVTTISPGQ